MLLQKMPCLFYCVAGVARISRAQVVQAFKVDSHVVGLVGCVVAKLAVQPSVLRPLSICTDHV